MTHCFARIALVLLLAAAAPAAVPAAAQTATQTTVTGVVADADGLPVIGATVVVDGRAAGAATDLDGRYRFTTDASGAVTLVASSVGYSTVRRAVTLSGGTQTQDFILATDALGLDEVFVTGVANPVSKIESSVSITTLSPREIQQNAPRTTAEIFRTIPGVRSEASGGDGNTNITVRGVPISAGGSRYLQLQEDGLPVMLFGDMAFATSDIFLRADATVGRLEAIRGGSASTLASNSPAGIINFVSRTGDVAGGSIATTAGLDYNSRRIDFEFGGPATDDLAFHAGGFFRTGTGTRSTGFLAEQGGQLRANVTRRFETGFARLYVKLLNDRTPAYLPMPVQVSGTNDSPTWESVPGFSANNDTPHTVFLQQNAGFGAEGERRVSELADGLHPVSTALGLEFLFDLGDGWTVQNRGRGALNSGRFVSPVPSSVGAPAAQLRGGGQFGVYDANGDGTITPGENDGGIDDQTGRDLTGALLYYADDNARISRREQYDGTLLQSIVLFDTELRNFNNFFNDAQLSRTFTGLDPVGPVTFTAGLFTGIQRVNMAWLWNSYLMDVSGDNARLVDIFLPTATDTVAVSQDGLFAYGAAPFGNCCAVSFDATYNVTAPYAALSIEATPELTLDGSVRYDAGNVTGTGSGGSVGAIDVNGDGVIAPVEERVNRIDFAQRNVVDYAYDYVSYSVGANYRITPQSAVFARVSDGAAAQADRVIFPTGTYVETDPSTFNLGKFNSLFQVEAGLKQRVGPGALFLTGFYAVTNEAAGFEASTQRFISNDYRAFGAELEASVAVQGFDVRGAATAVAAEITSGANDGNRPRRQPVFQYSLVPTYRRGPAQVGVGLIGQTSSYAQDSNQLRMPAYALVNAFASVDLSRGLTLGVNANNLLNALGFTESEEGAITENQVNYLRARSVVGRTIAATLRYGF